MVDCRGYSKVCVLCRSTHLARHIVYMGLAILRKLSSGCVSGAVFALPSWSSLWICLRLCWLLWLCMSLASDSSNGMFVPSCLYMSWNLSSRLLSIEQTVVPSSLCIVVCVCCVE